MEDATFSLAFSGRRNNFDFLRFFFAGVVIYAHSYSLPAVDVLSTHDVICTASSNTIHSGVLAVDAFFIVSGFLITMSWERSRDAQDYIERRILRIYPGFVVASIVTLLFFGPLCADSVSGFFHSLNPHHLVAPFILKGVADVPPMSGATRPTTLNGSLWTIKWEFLCYLLVVVIGTCGILKHRWTLVLWSILFSALAACQLHIPEVRTIIEHLPFGDSAASNVPRLLSSFLVGMVFYVYRENISRTRLLFFASLIVFVLGIVAVPFWPLLFTALPFSFAYLIFYCASSNRVRIYNFARHGDFSYGVYLYAYPIQQLLMLRLSIWNPVALFAAAMPLSCGCAFLSWHLIERPFLKAKKRLTSSGVDKARSES